MIAEDLRILSGEDGFDGVMTGDDAYAAERGKRPWKIGPDRLALVHWLELEELQCLRHDLGGREIGEMEAGLRHDRHREPHALRTVLLEHAPAGDVAKPLGPAANHALRVDGADAADYAFLVTDEKAVVGLVYSPVLQESLGPLSGASRGAKMLVEELAECRQITVPYRFERRQRHGLASRSGQ